MNTDLIKTASDDAQAHVARHRGLEALDESLVRALSPSSTAQGRLAAQGLARALRRCLSTDGRLLDFCQLSLGRRDLPGALPVAAWQALQTAAQAINGHGIVKVAFPVESAGMPLAPVIEGLNRLPVLASVHLPVLAEGSDLDLSRLQTRAQEPVVVLTGHTAGLRVTAPVGLRVEAVGHEVADARSVVSYVDSDHSAIGDPRTVPGVIYRRADSQPSRPVPAEFAGTGVQAAPMLTATTVAPGGGVVPVAAHPGPDALDPPATGEHQAVAGGGSEPHERSLGASSTHGGRASSSRPGDAAGRTAARQLAIQWLHDRWNYHRHKAGLQALQTSGAAAAVRPMQVPALPPRAYEQMRHRGAHALFDASQFGNMIRQELLTMRPGDLRHFAVCTERHLMGLEIHIKVGRHGHESRDEYIVNLFDPADATGLKRVVTDTPDWFRGRGLDAWGDMVGHFDSARHIGSLFHWPSVDKTEVPGRPVGVQLHIASAHFMSLEFLRHALGEGAVRGVAAFARQAFASAEAARPICHRLLRGDASSGLIRAMQLGRADAIAQWADAVLRAPAEVFTSDQRFGLLAFDAAGRSSARGAPPLVMAFAQGQYRAVAAFTEAVARARRGVLAAAQHLELLMAPDAQGRPALHALSDADNWRRTRHSPDPDLAIRQQKAAYRYVLAIATSELPDAVKRQVCRSSYRRQGLAGLLRSSTAARAAIDAGHAGVAGAMVAAILDAGITPQATADLLRHLGVPLEQVLDALVRPGARGLPWAVRIVESLEQSGLRSREIARLQDRFGWVRREAHTLEARLSPVALPSERDALAADAGQTHHEPA